MSIAILTPSRGRPERFAEMAAAAKWTAEGDVRIYCGLDYDDPARQDYSRDRRGLDRFYTNVTFVFGPRQHLSAWTNQLAKLALQDGHDIIGSLGDDHRPRSQGWDTDIEFAMAYQSSGLVYCDDGYQGENCPTAPFWAADVIRALGFYCPPALAHMYVDNFWLKLAQDIGRCTYLPSVLIEHMHPIAGKAQSDQSYRESDALMARDRQAYGQLIESPQYHEMVERARTAIERREAA